MELLTNILPLIGGGVFGAMIRLWANAQQAKADAHKRTMEALTTRAGINNDVNQMAKESKGFAWTRRFIVVAVTSVVVGAFWLTSPITVPLDIVTGGSYLFGLIDTTVHETVYETIEGGRVILPILLPSFQTIIGVYIGAGTIGRLR